MPRARSARFADANRVADRAAEPQRPRPRYEPLRAETVHELAEPFGSGVGPAMLATEPTPLAKTAWTSSAARQPLI
ncbi:hypothetical protein [Streptomyces sp. NBC_01235]|uniref:hypothetical protein n=1 Tax=Streptomyces sp. NBC_01235 TaxID=2903788 RepID=UPI002E1120A6|nr:hypothetical protein OG289_48655 [Streptomyces sp. NBC_01235]